MNKKIPYLGAMLFGLRKFIDTNNIEFKRVTCKYMS